MNVLFASLYGCAFLTTFNDLDEPVFESKRRCNDQTVFYRVYTFGSYYRRSGNEETFFRNEWKEIELDSYIKSIPELPRNISPYPKSEKNSYINNMKTNIKDYDINQATKTEREWKGLIVKGELPRKFRILDIYITDFTRNHIHGSGTGMYGLFLSALTLGIIPSYFTYDFEVFLKITNEKGESTEVKSIRRDGSHIGSIFLYFHSKSHSLFSEEEPLRDSRKWPLERMIGQQVANSSRANCRINN